MKTPWVRSSLVPALAWVAACSSDPVIDGPDVIGGPQGSAVQLVEVASGLASPLYLTSPPGDPRLFVVEQPGRVRLIRDGSLTPEPFLDLTDRVSTGGERGLLGLAFDPDFAENGRFFASFTARDGSSRVEVFRAEGGSDQVDASTARLVLELDQPYSNHNGGHITFGPDGMLYLGLGDGGSGGDPLGNGQNTGTLLGAILRLDVSHSEAVAYSVPADNPFADGVGGRAEIWHYGLRNPWRFSFDIEGGRLWIADVGQNRWEEVNAVAAAQGGLNFGWSTMEGSECFSQASCSTEGLTLPVAVYGRDQGCSVTGGYVYRGSAIPALQGRYLFGDYCEGWIRTLLPGEAGSPVEPGDLSLPSPGRITSFGEDAGGELYVMVQEGSVYRLAPPA